MLLTHNRRSSETVLRIVWLIPFDKNIRIKKMTLLVGLSSSITCYRLTSHFHVRWYRQNAMSCFMEEIKPCQEHYILLSGTGRRKNKFLKH